MRPPFTLGIAITAKEQALRDSQEYYGPMVEVEDDQEPEWWERRVRRDSLPEGANYVDEGCEYAPACLSCPFASCRYDLAQRSLLGGHGHNLHRYAMFMALREQGLSIDQASRQAGISRRTGFRWLAQMRGEPS